MLLAFGLVYGMLFGGAMVHQKSYCECFRDDFKGAFCESIKGKGEQGSCELKK